MTVFGNNFYVPHVKSNWGAFNSSCSPQNIFFQVVKPHPQDLSEIFCCCWFRKTWMADVILPFSFFWLSWINKELTVTELYVFFLPHETRTDKQNILMHSGQLINVIKTCIALVLFELSWTLSTSVDSFLEQKKCCAITVGPKDARFLGPGKMCVAHNSCNLSYV